VVQEGVERSEAELAVTAKDRSGGAPEGSAGHRTGVGLDRRERGFADRGRAPTLLAGYHGPQLFSQRVGALERLEAAAGDLEDLLFGGIDLVERLVTLDLQLEATVAWEARPSSVGVERSTGDRRVRGAAIQGAVRRGSERPGEVRGRRHAAAAWSGRWVVVLVHVGAPGRWGGV
jgi:hypothetical protein